MRPPRVAARYRRWGAAVASASLVLLTSTVSLAQASDASPAGPNVITSPSPTVVGPDVVLPSQQVPVSLPLGNTSASIQRIPVTFSGWCFNAASIRLNFVDQVATVLVPGDPGPAPLGVRILAVASATLTVPSACAHFSDVETDGTITAVLEQPPLTGTVLLNFHIGKPFTAANFRYNLALRTHGAPAESDAHHELPQKFRIDFVNLGLNIDDPQYGRWWCNRPGVPTNHTAQAADYNREWTAFFQSHTSPPPTAQQAVAYMKSIQGSYTYTCP